MWSWIKKNILNKDKNVQECLIVTEDNRIVHEQMDTLKGCAVNNDKMEAYVLDAENMIKRKSTGDIVQVLAERSVAPLAIRGIRNREVTRATKNAIGQETISQELQRIGKKNARDSIVTKITLLVSIPCVTVLIIVAVNLWQGNSIL